MDIVIDNLTWKEAESWERFLIDVHGRSQFNKGPLCNMTNGGDGTLGRVVSDRERRLISRRMTGVFRPHVIRAAADANKKPIMQLSKSGELIKIWDCASDAVRNGIGDTHISECAKGKRPSSGGYVWKFVNNENKEQYGE